MSQGAEVSHPLRLVSMSYGFRLAVTAEDTSSSSVVPAIKSTVGGDVHIFYPSSLGADGFDRHRLRKQDREGKVPSCSLFFADSPLVNPSVIDGFS